MTELLVEEVAAQRTGAIKIGPFGSSLPRSAMAREGLRVYGQENLIARDWGVGNRRITRAKFDSLSTCELRPGDVVIGMMGSLGNCEVFPSDAERGLMDSHLLRIQVNRRLLTPEYLRLLLLCEETTRQIDRLSHGSIMAGLSSKVVRKLRLSVPPLEEQRRIAEILDTIDETIRATERVIAKYNSIRAGLASDLLTGVLGVLSPEWRVCRLGDLGVTAGGGTPSRDRGEYWDGTIPWLTPGELTASTAKYVTQTRDSISQLGLAESGARIVPERTLLITSRASIGSCVLAGRPMATNQGFKNLIPGPEVDPSYLFYLGRTLGREMTRRASGTTFLEISGKEFRRIKVRLPPLEEQRRIAKILDTIDETIRSNEKKRDKLRQLRSGLAADLLSGRVRTVAA